MQDDWEVQKTFPASRPGAMHKASILNHIGLSLKKTFEQRFRAGHSLEKNTWVPKFDESGEQYADRIRRQEYSQSEV